MTYDKLNIIYDTGMLVYYEIYSDECQVKRGEMFLTPKKWLAVDRWVTRNCVCTDTCKYYTNNLRNIAIFVIKFCGNDNDR